MSDINELIHAIGLAEALASGVAREADRFPTEDVTRIREALASARIRAEEIGISAALICDETERDDRLKRAINAITAAGGEPFRPTGRFIVSDEVGASEVRSQSTDGVVPFTLRLDVLRAREALFIAEHRQEAKEANLVDLRAALAKATLSLAEAESERRDVVDGVVADGEPIEVFVTDENLERLRRAVGQI